MNKESIKGVVARNVRIHRHAAGISQELLSDLCGMNYAYIGMLERQKFHANAETLEKIARFFDITEQTLVDRTTTDADIPPFKRLKRKDAALLRLKKLPQKKEDLKIVIGRNIKLYRKRADLSQTKLAVMCSFPHTYIGFMERARHSPTIATLEIIADGLGITEADLLDRETTDKDIPK